MAALKPLKPLRPLRPLRGLPEPDPARVNAQRIAVLATKPQPRIQPQPVPHSLIAGYAVQLERIAARAYQIADSTVGAAIRRQQALAYSYQPSLRPDADGDAVDPDHPHGFVEWGDPADMTPAKRAAYQNHNHTPAQKRQLDLPLVIGRSIKTMDAKMIAYERSLDLWPIIMRQAGRVEQFAARVNTQMLETIGLRPIDPGTAIEAARDQWVKANAALIKSIPQEVAQRVGQVTREMVEGGARWETIAKRLQDEEGISRRRANLIARDQTSKYNGALNQAHQQAAGIEYYEWRGAMDARERPEHVAMQGRIVKWSEPPPMGHPGEPIQCLPGRSPLQVANFPLKAWRRWHTGKLTTIVCANGKSVQCTPNHPILTRSGWKPAGLIDDRDELVCNRVPMLGGALAAEVHGNDVTIEQVFNALAMIGARLRQTTSGMDFHGDAAEAQQVDVVRIDWGLCDHVDADGAERARQIFLASANVGLVDESGYRSVFAMLVALGFPADSVVRGLAKLLSLLWVGVGHSSEHGLGSTPQSNAVSVQHCRDSHPLDIVPLCEGLDAVAGCVEGDAFRMVKWLGIARRCCFPALDVGTVAHHGDAQVFAVDAQGFPDLVEGGMVLSEQEFCRVKKFWSEDFSGHVYNLETATGWYCSNVIVHNCRCVATPVVAQSKISTYEPVTSKELKQRVKALGPRIKDQ